MNHDKVTNSSIMQDDEAKRNTVEFEVSGDYALFSDPATRVGGEKCTYQIPTYEALKGIASSIYWKPTFIWVIDAVRIMNPIRMESKAIRLPKYQNSKNDLAYFTYLKDCRYQVRAHFEWNQNRADDFQGDWNENKHHNIAKRMIEAGGRRDIFLGTRECQGYVKPCTFGEGEGYYDNIHERDFGLMYHGITYADEAYSKETEGKMTTRFWNPVMKNGVIRFKTPEQCELTKTIKSGVKIKKFDNPHK